MEEGHDVLVAGLDGQLTDQLSIKIYCFTSLNSFLNIVGVMVYDLCGWSMLFPLGDGAELRASVFEVEVANACDVFRVVPN